MEDDAAGLVRASNKPGKIAETLEKTFEETVSGLRPIAEILLAQVRDLGPREATIEFGIKFGTEAGVILAKAAAEGACKVTLHWKAAERFPPSNPAN